MLFFITMGEGKNRDDGEDYHLDREGKSHPRVRKSAAGMTCMSASRLSKMRTGARDKSVDIRKSSAARKGYFWLL